MEGESQEHQDPRQGRAGGVGEDARHLAPPRDGLRQHARAHARVHRGEAPLQRRGRAEGVARGGPTPAQGGGRGGVGEGPQGQVRGRDAQGCQGQDGRRVERRGGNRQVRLDVHDPVPRERERGRRHGCGHDGDGRIQRHTELVDGHRTTGGPRDADGKRPHPVLRRAHPVRVRAGR